MPLRRALGRRRPHRPRWVCVWRGYHWGFTLVHGDAACLVGVLPFQRDSARNAYTLYLESFKVARRPAAAASPEERGPAASSSKFLDGFPMLKSYLSDLCYEDTKDPREPSSLIIVAREGRWQVTLKDPSTCTQLRVQVDRLEALWGALESLLVSETAPWQTDAWAASRARPKGKKR